MKSGMYVDLHLHLLPGIDDGARTIEESLAMARRLVAAGYRRAAVSPHIRPGLFDNAAGPLRALVEEVREALAAESIPLALSVGAEHYLCPEVIERIGAGQGLPLADSRHLLIEAPLAGPVPALEQVVFELEVGGRTPIFAHPERCECLQDLEAVRRLRERGAHFQLDLGSLAGAYGRGPRRHARRLLEAGLYSVAGSDLHRQEQAEKLLGKWLAALTERVDEATAGRLLSENPRRVLDGEALP